MRLVRQHRSEEEEQMSSELVKEIDKFGPFRNESKSSLTRKIRGEKLEARKQQD